MTEEKDIVGLSVPFAAGTAVGALLLYAADSPFALSSVTAIVLAFSLFACVRIPQWRVPALVVSLALCGILCAFSQAISSSFTRPGALVELTHRVAFWLKNTIDCIPYHDPDVSALVKALLTGDKSALSKDTIAIFRAAGASHILALSGLHLGLIYAMLLRLLSLAGNAPLTKSLRSVLIMGVCGFYALATGASPSIVRAFLFISINEMARMLGRERKPLRTYCAALFIQMALNPGAVNSIGFWLSYLAMAGIVLLYPRLREWYPADSRWDIVRRIWDGAALAISCQIFTAPLVWVVFGTFPKYFLVTNLLAMPLTSVAMLLSVGTATLSALGLCPALLVVIDEKILNALVWTLRTISEM